PGIPGMSGWQRPTVRGFMAGALRSAKLLIIRNSKGKKTKTINAFLLACGILAAQTPQAPNPTQQTTSTETATGVAGGSTPIYRVTVVAHTSKAINYNHRSGSTRIGFRGTVLMPLA